MQMRTRTLKRPFMVPKLNRGPENVCLSLVVPTYNEAENIRELIFSLVSKLDAKLPNNYEIIVVDDDSRDLTWEIVQGLSSEYASLRLIRRRDEKGLSSAVIRGWQISQGEFLGVIDGDLQHPPATLLRLIEVMLGDDSVDLAVASRYIEEGGTGDWGIRRRLISSGAKMLGLIFIPEVIRRVSDPMSGYFIVRRSAIAERFLRPMGYKILLEVMAKGNIRKIAEAGYIFQKRAGGKNKIRPRIFLEYILHLMLLRLYKLRIKIFKDNKTSHEF
jgi:dolichol-phosphate mannosyltransferase